MNTTVQPTYGEPRNIDAAPTATVSASPLAVSTCEHTATVGTTLDIRPLLTSSLTQPTDSSSRKGPQMNSRFMSSRETVATRPNPRPQPRHFAPPQPRRQRREILESTLLATESPAEPTAIGCPKEIFRLPLSEAKRLFVESFERTFIEAALQRNHGNVSATARSLGLHRQSLQRKLAQLKLGPHHGRTDGQE